MVNGKKDVEEEKKNLTIEDLLGEEVGKDHKLAEFEIIYDNPGIPFESHYFWLVDFLKESLGLEIDKISDYWGASPGSMFFRELGQGTTILIQRAKELGELINGIIRSIMAILYEIKWLKTRIELYDKYKKLDSPKASEKEKEEAKAALLSLKSTWLDKVDIQKGGASLLAMSGIATGRSPIRTSTLVDVFMISRTPKDVEDLYKKGIINKQVANIVKARLQEFNSWLKESEREIRNRYKILFAYLKHQVNALYTYMEFARPYFRFARKLLPREYENPDVVTVFETAIQEVTLLAKRKPETVKIWDENSNSEKEEEYQPFYVIKMYFRSYPVGQRTGQFTAYTHLGKLRINFYAFLVKKEELEEIRKEELRKDLLYLEGLTRETLNTMIEDLCKVFEEEGDTKGVEWLFELREKKRKEDKKEDKKNEKNKENNTKSQYNIFLDLLMAFDFIFNPLKDLLKKGFGGEKVELKFKKKRIQEEMENKLKEIKEGTYDLLWTIYKIYKKSFRMLTWKE